MGGTNYRVHGAKPYIYAKLDWSDPAGTLFYVVLVTLAVVFLHVVVLYLVNSLFRRDWGFRRLLLKAWDGKAAAEKGPADDGDRLTVPLKAEEELEAAA